MLFTPSIAAPENRAIDAHGTAHAAADVEHFHSGLQSQPQRQVVLGTCQRGIERFALGARREVKRLTPAVLVEVGDDVVVVVDHRGVLRFARLDAAPVRLVEEPHVLADGVSYASTLLSVGVERLALFASVSLPLAAITKTAVALWRLSGEPSYFDR